MSFFEPLPPMPDPAALHQWEPPFWDRPSEGVLGALVPLGLELHRDSDLVLFLDHARAYPNGFVLAIEHLGNPRVAALPAWRSGPPTMPRLGVEFSDGRRGGDRADLFPGAGANWVAMSRSLAPGAPPPQGPIVRPVGGGTGPHRGAASFWVYPLPPAGELRVHVEWPARHVPELMVAIDVAPILAAAPRAVEVWR
jgi:hypothetical protein